MLLSSTPRGTLSKMKRERKTTCHIIQAQNFLLVHRLFVSSEITGSGLSKANLFQKRLCDC